jgi:ATP adenylyltransferase
MTKQPPPTPRPKTSTDTKQIAYREARFTQQYDNIWQSVGKCVFCDLREKYIFFEENDVVMAVSLFAYIDGHLMIIPRRHIRTTKDLTEREWQTIRKFTYIAKKLIRQVHRVQGMQIIEKEGAQAQSTVSEHIHFHCVPFDAPDLSTWNYRQLKLTPLENAQAYREAKTQIASLSSKYNTKYAQPSTLRIICDAIILNAQDEMLLQQRREGLKLDPDWLTLPGGTVSQFDQSLESELMREIAEETGVTFQPETATLIASRLSRLSYQRQEPHLNTRIVTTVPFLWNTYLINTALPPSAFTPGDDCANIEWIKRADASSHPRVSPEIRRLIEGLTP